MRDELHERIAVQCGAAVRDLRRPAGAAPFMTHIIPGTYVHCSERDCAPIDVVVKLMMQWPTTVLHATDPRLPEVWRHEGEILHHLMDKSASLCDSSGSPLLSQGSKRVVPTYGYEIPGRIPYGEPLEYLQAFFVVMKRLKTSLYDVLHTYAHSASKCRCRGDKSAREHRHRGASFPSLLQRLQWALDIASVVFFCHHCGVAIGDLKSLHVMFAGEGFMDLYILAEQGTLLLAATNAA